MTGYFEYTGFYDISNCVFEPGAAIVYYGKKGERIFEIAKNHNVSPQIIMDENVLENDLLTEDTMLVIPAFEQ